MEIRRGLLYMSILALTALASCQTKQKPSEPQLVKVELASHETSIDGVVVKDALTASLVDYNSGNLPRAVFPPSTTAQKVNSGYRITIEANGKRYTAFFRSYGEEHEKRVFGKTLEQLAKDTKPGDRVQIQIHQNAEKGHQPNYQTGNNQLTGLTKK